MLARKIPLLLFVTFFVSQCMDQYDPRAFWNKLDDERAMAHRDLPQLTEDGKLPAAKGNVQQVAKSPIDQKYSMLCVTCHGEDGKANTPAGNALNPKPRNFTDATWQDGVTDEHIAQVISKGGAAVGLSASMAAWEAMLPGDLVEKMVQKVRSFKGK